MGTSLRRAPVTARLGLALGVLIGAAGCGGGSRREVAAEALACPRCSVVLISIDTLRADRLGVYGHDRPTSPSLDRFATGALVFERAYATSFVTAPSHMSMLTGVHPSVHGVRNARPGGTHPPPDRLVTLAESLRDAGWHTVAVVGGGNVSAALGFNRGFDEFRTVEDLGAVDVATTYLSQRAEAPLLLFFHTYHVHDPYLPSPPYDSLYDPDYTGRIDTDIELHGTTFATRRARFWSRVDADRPEDVRHVQALYDGAITELDARLGPLLDQVAGRDDVLTIVTADHGEEFLEHGRWLHEQLYDELLRVPLIMRLPALTASQRIATRVSLVDLAPTVLDLVGLAPLGQFQGRSLLPVVTGEESGRDVFAELPDHGRTLIRDSIKVLDLPRERLAFDLDADPGERRDLGFTTPRAALAVRRLRKMRAENVARRAQIAASPRPTVVLDAETTRRLRALGYLE